MTLTATPIRGGDLKPGDLFSTLGMEYWGNFPHFPSLAEMVYVRTFSPPTLGDEDEMVFKITITPEEPK